MFTCDIKIPPDLMPTHLVVLDPVDYGVTHMLKDGDYNLGKVPLKKGEAFYKELDSEWRPHAFVNASSDEEAVDIAIRASKNGEGHYARTFESDYEQYLRRHYC